MKTKPLGKTGMNISTVTYGGIVSTMNTDPNFRDRTDQQEQSDAYVRFALERGVNYFDVAPTYGDAQTRLGESLRGVRDRVYLACKTTERDYDSARAEMEESFRLLHTDHFDNYQLHALNTPEELEQAFSEHGVMKLIEERKAAGQIRHVGITSHSEAVVLEALRRYDFETVLFPLNWMMNMAYGMGNALLRQIHEKNIGLLCMKSMIERGFHGADDPARARFPKSWCKPFDPQTQPELLLAAMKYSWSLGIDTLIPAGDIEHFTFAVEHADELATQPLSEAEQALLTAHLPEASDTPFFDPKTASVEQA